MNSLKYVRLLCLLAFAVALLSLGCNKQRKTGVVRGKVNFGDKKVAGAVRFVAEDGAVGEGVIYNDGTYEVLDAPVGKCKVAIITEHLEKKAGGPTVPGGGVPGMKDNPSKDKSSGGGGSKPPAEAQAKMGKAPDLAEAPPNDRTPNTKYVQIPGKYKNPETSELSFEVKTGEQEYEITIK